MFLQKTHPKQMNELQMHPIRQSLQPMDQSRPVFKEKWYDLLREVATKSSFIMFCLKTLF